MTPIGLVAASAGLNLGLITVLKMVPPTKSAGEKMFTRVSNAKSNWSNHCLRSVVEMASWLTILFSGYHSLGSNFFPVRGNFSFQPTFAMSFQVTPCWP